ncbi:glutaredoxin family protein [Neptuniibacter marinus]|uniref:glutaredoxin family protein n=1 Tax=Neptuniibacter marinus TaxID=1806670 RepID=UPI00082ECBF5|nr:glutaredoxin family protein [Neptuniibacter marinus]
MRELELMGTLGCHLCEVAEAVVTSVVNMDVYAIYQVDIAEDDDLMEKYALTIPVLVDLQTGKELMWPFDGCQLTAFLNELSV